MADNVIIYDHSKGLYWGENSSGYECAQLAGVYTRDDAERIANGCRGDRRLEFLPIPADHIPALKAAKAAADKLLSCILSVRQQNTPEWMAGIAEDINEYAAAVCDSDRVRFDGDGLRITKEKQ